MKEYALLCRAQRKQLSLHRSRHLPGFGWYHSSRLRLTRPDFKNADDHEIGDAKIVSASMKPKPKAARKYTKEADEKAQNPELTHDLPLFQRISDAKLIAIADIMNGYERHKSSVFICASKSAF